MPAFLLHAALGADADKRRDFIDAQREKIRLSNEAIVDAETTKVEAAAFEAAGGDPVEAQHRYEAAEATITRQHAAIAHTNTVITRCEADIARLEEQAEHAEYMDAYAAAEAACGAAATVAAKFAEAAATAARREEDLRKARAKRDKAIDRAMELLPDGIEFVGPANADEPDWPAAAPLLVETLTGGPSQPLTLEKARLEKSQRDRSAPAARGSGRR